MAPTVTVTLGAAQIITRDGQPSFAPATQQPFWGDTQCGASAYIPSDPYDPSKKNYEPNWEAHVGQWSEWDTATINDVIVPGVVNVKHLKAHRVQKKQSPGSNGATPTLLGLDPAEIDFKLRMWTAKHQQQFESLVNMILEKIYFATAGPAVTGGTPDQRQAIAIFTVKHPALAIWRINSLYFLRGTGPEPSGTPGIYEATLKFQEYLPIQTNTTQVTERGTGEVSSVPTNYPVNPKPSSTLRTTGTNPR